MNSTARVAPVSLAVVTTIVLSGWDVSAPEGNNRLRMTVPVAVNPDGSAIVGLSLEPGGYPAMGLSPGDLVNVVRTVDPADPITDGTDQGDTSDDGADASIGTGDVVIARGATVVSVEELASDRLLVSILAPEGDAVAVAARAGSGSLRLVQVSP